MRDFEYVEARSVGEAISLLAEKGERARPLAGGTDILPQMRAGRRVLDLIVDIKAIPETNELSYDPARGLRLGAAVPCYKIYQDQAVCQAYPGLIDAAALIGGIQIQGRATAGGNLCNAAPSADLIPPLIVLNGIAEVAGPKGTREVPVENFCTAPGRNVLEDGEFLVAIRLPSPIKNSGARYLRFIPRNEMDIAVAGVGSSVVLGNGGGSIVSARIALASVAPTPLLAEEAGANLSGQRISDETIQKAAELAMAASRPINDMRGTMRQRRHLVGVLTRRTLQGAIERAKEAQNNA